jgi:predicted membrane-bound spermidine synthase
MSDTGDRMRVVVYYAIWATFCAAIAGVVVALIHTWFFSYNPGRSAVIETLFSGIVTALAVAAGQGAVALVTGSVLAQIGRALNFTVLLGLLIGVFDFVMYFVQMAVPATELGWVPDIAILVVATVVITLLGARTPAAAA